MSIKILATADLHLGKSSSSIPGCEEISVKYTWKLLMDYSIKNEIDVLLLCGDIVDQDNRYFEAIGTLQAGFEILKKAGISVYMVAGNHDYNVLPQMVSDNRFKKVHLLGANGKWQVEIFTNKEGQKLQLVGWSFPKRFVTEDPLFGFEDMKLDKNFPVIGLLHGEVDNLISTYGPIKLNDLSNKPVDIWLLGHIHKPQELREHSPAIWYTGSPHALSAKEPGIHGPLLLVVDDKNSIKVNPVALSPVRYESIQIDVSKANDEVMLHSIITAAILREAETKMIESEGIAYLVYDVCLVGEHANSKQIELWALPIRRDYNPIIEPNCRISVRKVTNEIRPAIMDMGELAKQSSPAGILADSILALEDNRSTPFLEEYIRKWNSRYQNINDASSYQPLRLAQRLNQKVDNNSIAKKYVLTECRRLLGELLMQQTKID